MNILSQASGMILDVCYVFVSILKQAHEDRNSEARVLLGKYQGGKNINDFLAITLMQNHGSTPHRRM